MKETITLDDVRVGDKLTVKTGESTLVGTACYIQEQSKRFTLDIGGDPGGRMIVYIHRSDPVDSIEREVPGLEEQFAALAVGQKFKFVGVYTQATRIKLDDRTYALGDPWGWLTRDISTQRGVATGVEPVDN